MSDLVRLSHVFDETNTFGKVALTAGAGLLLVALGWGAGAKIDAQVSALRGPSPEQIAARAAADSAQKALGAEQAHKQEIAALRAHVDGLKTKLEAQAQKVRDSEAAVAALQKSLGEEKAQSLALRARMEKMTIAAARETVKPPQQPQRRPPGALVDLTPTASIAKPLPTPARVEAGAQHGQAQAAKRYRAYVLRDINDGMAMIEGEDGMVEAAPGDVLPGGARVQRLEKRGGEWIVVTDRGYIAPEGRWAD
jgi:hypothetical protein